MEPFRFRVGPFPVEIQPSILVLAGIFFLLWLDSQWSVLLIVGTIGIAAASILVHELGHATIAKLQRLDPIHITLHGLGGTTRHRPASTPGRSLLVILAGPGAGLLLSLLGTMVLWLPLTEGPRMLLRNMVWLNLLWTLFNLLPIVPLDGGHALSAFLRMFLGPEIAWPVTWAVGALCSIGLCVVAYAGQEMFLLLFAGMFAWQNVQNLRTWRSTR